MFFNRNRVLFAFVSRSNYSFVAQVRTSNKKFNLSTFCEQLTSLTMSSKPNLKPPQAVQGLTVLNKLLFEKNITVPCLVLKNVSISRIMPVIKKYLLKMLKFKPVQAKTSGVDIYLNPEIISTWQDIAPSDQDALNALNITESDLHSTTHVLHYDNYSVDSIFKAVLPTDVEGMSSFTTMGHIVHVNLREHLLPYKDLIGQVLYEKIPNCRSVVNKVTNIDNTFRNFEMELLRGDSNMQTRVKENRCIFEFDFSQVYWNSRLCTEHERIVNLIQGGDVVFDVFAGVGPFSVPLAKKKCRVFANDLNPEAYKWLNHNSTINKIDSEFLKSYNKDGRDFILGECKTLMAQFLNERIYIIMNLPALGPEFLHVFNGLNVGEFVTPPVVIVYCFAKGQDCENIAKQLVCDNMGWNIEDKIIEIFRVRTVSSMKEMMRVMFKLDEEILSQRIRKRKHEKQHGEKQGKQIQKEAHQGRQEIEGQDQSQGGENQLEADQRQKQAENNTSG